MRFYSLEHNTRLLYLSGKSSQGELQRTIFEFTSFTDGWIQWRENILPVGFENSTFVQLDADFCSNEPTYLVKDILNALKDHNFFDLLRSQDRGNKFELDQVQVMTKL